MMSPLCRTWTETAKLEIEVTAQNGQSDKSLNSEGINARLHKIEIDRSISESTIFESLDDHFT
jgi:hypothetical protein